MVHPGFCYDDCDNCDDDDDEMMTKMIAMMMRMMTGKYSRWCKCFDGTP